VLGNVKMSGVSTVRGIKYAKIHRYLADIMESDFFICEAGCGSGLGCTPKFYSILLKTINC